MTLALSIADAGTGLGGTATLSGTTGAAVTLFSARYQDPVLWSTVGTRTGDGTIPIVANAAAYWFYAATASLFTAPTFAPLTDGTAVHYRCLVAIQAGIQVMALAGMTTPVSLKWEPRLWETIDTSLLPFVLVAPFDVEGQPGMVTGKDDVEYPCMVAIMDKLNQDYVGGLAQRLLWRQRIFRHFRNQRLPGVPEIITTPVEPKPIVDPTGLAKNVWFSFLLLKPTSREVRG